MPPEHLWEDGEGLDEWWKTVEARRSDGTVPSGGSSDDEPAEELVSNDMARQFRKMAE